MPLNVAIDVHKAATGAVVLGLMAALGVATPQAWVYAALHGSYGLAWVLKDLAFPDRRWRRRVPWWSAGLAWLFLSHYWVAPAILVLGQAGAVRLAGWQPAPLPGLAVAVAVHTVGLALMLGADAQKNVWLGVRREASSPDAVGPGLLTTGLFRRVRHPNYLGEMLVYGSYALIVNHWLPWVILVAVWLLFFFPNMLAIEASLARYPDYEDWRRRTGFLLPRPRR